MNPGMKTESSAPRHRPGMPGARPVPAARRKPLFYLCSRAIFPPIVGPFQRHPPPRQPVGAMTVFTPHQDTALKAVADWLSAKPGQGATPQVFRLFGYAGTGKTTLARHVAAHVDGTVL